MSHSFSGYASKFEVSPSPDSLGTMGGYAVGQNRKVQLGGRGVTSHGPHRAGSGLPRSAGCGPASALWPSSTDSTGDA